MDAEGLQLEIGSEEPTLKEKEKALEEAIKQGMDRAYETMPQFNPMRIAFLRNYLSIECVSR